MFFSTPFSSRIVATDYYTLLEAGLSKYADEWFATNGRLISFIYMHFLDFFNCTIDFYIISMKIIAITLGTASIYLLYKLLCSIFESYSNRKLTPSIHIAMYLLALSIILNPGSIEYFYYPECGTMCLGVFLTIWATRILYDDKNRFTKFRVFLLLFLSATCYQASVFLFLPLCIMILSAKLSHQEVSKEIIKKYCIDIIINVLTVILVLLCSFIIVRIMNLFYVASFHLYNSFDPPKLAELFSYLTGLLLFASEQVPIVIYTHVCVNIIILIFLQKPTSIANRVLLMVSILLIIGSCISEIVRSFVFL